LKSLAILAGIPCLEIFGPFFFADTATGVSLKNVRKTFCTDKGKVDCWFQLDVASAYSGEKLSQWIDDEFLPRWIGRDGLMP
jgi:hypothetical protein